MPRALHRTLFKIALFGAISIGSAFVFASVYVVVFHLSLPPTDGAYGQPMSRVFADPLVRGVASAVALVSGVVFWPVFYFTLRDRRLVYCLPIVLGVVILEIVLVTFFIHALVAWPVSYFALVIALVGCWAAGVRPSTRHRCSECGYDLRGLPDSRCPECGHRPHPA
ncbi:MAG: hypothetical protein GY715_14665 [Planctomycetes bacterium]|nr:hypothetical protein [Planctomycetota bacterium]